MIGTYGFSLIGKSHLEKQGVCQDANIVLQLAPELYFVAIADGVGSAKLSELGAKMAVTHLANYVEEHVAEAMDCKTRRRVLYAGFQSALKGIELLAQNGKNKICDYDTTLTAVIYDGNEMSFGHSGDGGIIKLGQDGIFTLVTEAQKGEAFNEVCPLRSGIECWSFGEIKDCAGLLLFTDGVLDVACPTMLKNQEEQLYTRFLSRFLPTELFGSGEKEIKIHKERVQQFLSENCGDIIRDDITAVAIWNHKLLPKFLGEEYFKEPDWETLKMERYYKLYPHLRPKEVKHETV